MNSMARRQEPITPDEYFEIEAASPVRHEYIEGYLHALAGASTRHNQIVFNISHAFRAAGRGTSCRTFGIEVRVQVSDTRYYYPDLAVVCNPENIEHSSLTQPCVVVEVLSPSTAGVDQREKLFAYRQIDALRAYLIVHQDEPLIEKHWLDDGIWRHDIISGEGVYVPCLDFNLSFDVVFEDVTFE
jgi:Uma2 family endonuclease